MMAYYLYPQSGTNYYPTLENQMLRKELKRHWMQQEADRSFIEWLFNDRASDFSI